MLSNLLSNPLVIVGVVLVGVFLVVPMIVAAFLRDVDAGTIRIVSWLAGNTVIYRGPGKSKEIPLLTTGTTISSKIINVDLDITDQTADLNDDDRPQPIKVRVLASAIVSVGDTDPTIKTAANRFFSKPYADQMSALTDLLSSSGRRARCGACRPSSPWPMTTAPATCRRPGLRPSRSGPSPRLSARVAASFSTV